LIGIKTLLLPTGDNVFLPSRMPRMTIVPRFALAIAIAALMTSTAAADKFDACPDPDAAREWVKACMQDNPYNTKEICEERALARFCSGE
jgi:hypothetical protein